MRATNEFQTKEVTWQQPSTKSEGFARSTCARQPDELRDPVHRGEQSTSLFKRLMLVLVPPHDCPRETSSEPLDSPRHLAPLRMRFFNYLKKKKKEFLVGTITFLVTVVLIPTVLALTQERLKQYFLGARLQLKPLASASGVFPSGTAQCIRQISSYEVSATDLVRDVKVTVTFPDQTKIVSANLIFTVALSGFTPSGLNTNSIELKLSHQLDAAKKAQVFFVTERPFRSSDQISSERPDIHVEGKDKNGNIVYE